MPIKAPISVLIPTLNEEVNIARCLESVSWSDDIVVFDSFSSDRTLDIAERFGARIVQRRFDDENSHRTASLHVGFKYDWVFNPDADEIATPELQQEIIRRVAECWPSTAAFRMRRKDIFMGTWLRHTGLYPVWCMRLFRPDKLSFERKINLNYVISGEEQKLEGHLIHYTFSKGVSAWFEKHNGYSSCEAMETMRSTGSLARTVRLIGSSSAVERRKGLKGLLERMPCRPLIRFCYEFCIRRAFLDGIAGLHYSIMISIYEYLISLKVNEARYLRVHAGAEPAWGERLTIANVSPDAQK
jgi:glycosyltransferase involved in cell wall biosynthesis